MAGAVEPHMRSLFYYLSIEFVAVCAVALVLSLVAGKSVGGNDDRAGGWPLLAARTSSLLFVLGIAPLVAVTLYVVGAALAKSPIAGPLPDTFFHRLGAAASYALPMLVTAMTLVGYALRERSSRFALAGGLVLCLSATAGLLLARGAMHLPLDAAGWVRLAQLNAAVGAVYVLAWLGTVWSYARRTAATLPRVDEYLLTQLAVALSLQLIVWGCIWCAVLIDPLGPPEWNVADIWGWGAALTVAAALLAWLAWRDRQRRWAENDVAPASAWQLSPPWVLIAGWSLSVLVAQSLYSWDVGNWLVFHGQLVGQIVAAWAVLGASVWSERRLRHDEMSSQRVARRAATAGWLVAGVLVAVVWCLRTVFVDPQRPYWALAGLASLVVLLATTAAWAKRGRYVYGARGARQSGRVDWLGGFGILAFAGRRLAQFLAMECAGHGAARAAVVVAELADRTAVGRSPGACRLAVA